MNEGIIPLNYNFNKQLTKQQEYNQQNQEYEPYLIKIHANRILKELDTKIDNLIRGNMTQNLTCQSIDILENSIENKVNEFLNQSTYVLLKNYNLLLQSYDVLSQKITQFESNCKKNNLTKSIYVAYNLENRIIISNPSGIESIINTWVNRKSNTTMNNQNINMIFE